MSFTKWLNTFPLIANKMKKKGRIGEIQILCSLFYGLVMKSSVAFANPSSTRRVDLGKKSLTQSAMQSNQQGRKSFQKFGVGERRQKAKEVQGTLECGFFLWNPPRYPESDIALPVWETPQLAQASPLTLSLPRFQGLATYIPWLFPHLLIFWPVLSLLIMFRTALPSWRGACQHVFQKRD